MTDREHVGRTMRDHYERVWSEDDPWSFDRSPFEQSRLDRQLAVLNDRRYRRTLEIGCGSGRFTRMLATVSDYVLGVDIAPSAVAKATSHSTDPDTVIDYRAMNIMDLDPQRDGPWDLVVMSETIYCLGWLYPMFDVGWLTARLFDATCDQGRMLLANTYGGRKDRLMHPWLIDTYRDMMRNIGYVTENEIVFGGKKDGVAVEILISLLYKPGGAAPVAV